MALLGKLSGERLKLGFVGNTFTRLNALYLQEPDAIALGKFANERGLPYSATSTTGHQ